mgnify:CR=1 FL=1
MADNNFKGTVEALFTGIDGVVSFNRMERNAYFCMYDAKVSTKYFGYLM